MTPSALVLAWCRFQPRTAALARALGGSALFVHSTGLRRGRSLLPLRYLRDALATSLALRRHRPEVVVAITPPVFAPLIAWSWCRRGRQLVVDCHTDALHSRRWGWALPLHRFLFARATAVLVHTEAAADEVGGWGANAILLPDDLPEPADAEPVESSGQPTVLVAGSLDAQEPVEQTIAAARLLPEVQFRLTGDTDQLTPGARVTAPPNLTFTGWLDYPRFLGEMVAADVVAAFSTDPGIMNRAAFEAVGLTRPLVLSNIAGLRARFGDSAAYCRNDPVAMANALRRALDDREQMARRSGEGRSRLEVERLDGLQQLRVALARSSPRPRQQPRALMLSQHVFPDNPTLRRNAEYLVSQGFEVDLVCTAEPGTTAPPVGGGLHLHRITLSHRRWSAALYPLEYAAFFARALPWVAWLSMRRRYDVVQVDNLPDFLVFAAFPARLRGSRIVLFMFELMPEMTAARLGAGPRHPLVRLTRRLEMLAISWADQVITVNEFCRQTLANRGVDPDRIEVVPNTQPAIRLGEHSAPASRILVTHATLVRRYGVQVAIEAMPDLLKRWPDVRLLVLGKGEYEGELKALARRIGVVEAVDFGGFVPWEEAIERVRQSAVGLVTVIDDGYGPFLLPNKLLEYASIGIPVACSRLAAISEQFPDDALAYFDPGDARGLAAAVSDLLADPSKAAKQVAQARDALRTLAWEEVSGRYLAALAAQPG